VKDKQMIFWMLRHGQTDWNEAGRWQGHTDIPLNATGESQAQKVAQFLSSFQIKNVVSSDLLRAQRTASLACAHLPASLDHGLREVHLGVAEGQTKDQIEKILLKDAALAAAAMNFDPKHIDFGYPRGEKRREALERFRASVQNNLQTKGGNSLFVTHGLILRIFIQSIWPKADDRVRAQNCALYEFETSNFDLSDCRLRQIFWSLD
jgi:broad specificity phosphatase PhoE